MLSRTTAAFCHRTRQSDTQPEMVLLPLLNIYPKGRPGSCSGTTELPLLNFFCSGESGIKLLASSLTLKVKVPLRL